MAEPFRLSIRVPFTEAIKAARDRGVTLSEDFYSDLPAKVRARAFTISGLASLDQMQAVMDNLTAVTETGKTFGDWKKMTLKDVPALASLPKGRLETIYRNAIQSHYAIGRHTEQVENASSRPFLMYSAINDGRTRDSHRAMNGHIAPVGDPVWQTRYPPWAHRCRCSVISLSEKQAIARGWKGAPREVGPKDKGDWEQSPVAGMGELARVESRRLSTATPHMRDSYEKFKHDAKDRAELAAIGDEIALKKPEWIKKGQVIYPDRDLSGFAEETDKAIYLAASDNQIKGFIPSAALLSASRKSKRGESLDFNEEYAVEVLWHELQHARTSLSTSGAPSETVIQFAARNSYHQLADVIGINVSMKADVMARGYGYRNEVLHLRAMLSHLGIQEKQAADEFLAMIETGNENSVAWNAANWMSAQTGVSTKSIRKAMQHFRLHGDPGWRRIVRDLSYGQSGHDTQAD